jgi:hypothetical protein
MPFKLRLQDDRHQPPSFFPQTRQRNIDFLRTHPHTIARFRPPFYEKDVIVMAWWTPRLHAILGGIVVTIGAFVMSEQAPAWTLILAAGATAFLWWQGRSIGAVWAWTTLGLGIESMTWPIVTMIQIRMEGNQPTEEQMGTILNAVLFGLFSSVFWVTFAFGLFKRMREPNTPPLPPAGSKPAPTGSKRKRARP